ncbi:pyruvate dehydrogenase (acetyl-transferring) E1 component subunit alpha [Arthrobacter sp. I2-34]|uniref:Pyruvate dehydrogenase (Acetyl-transferring) E1 component subunit alpha n=1 Tax=Arthrobacter hankyongi TaxID=2904801 RepID=A0ABS9L179_9MICC|nr:pyruvate dehydrogenase (acetyl-transferring) E1 component subunit alpha [Arthrobacter hankyongi]MCG2620402.1 pyruvate dehydrogenase (acetyl-transferring) E1 component subunit alpha [Arthrobacter hankyongi]
MSLAGAGPATGEKISEPWVQLLTPAGVRVPEPHYDSWLEDIDGGRLQGLYRDMVVVRRIDVEATALQRQGELALWPPLLGQEAAQIGSGRALAPDDFVFPSYRETGVAYCRGVEYADLVKVWRGNAPSSWDPYRLNMAPMQIIIGAQALHATGYAMATKFDGAETATMTYFGDGATSQGDLNEAMVFAASFQAPVLFFCQNNQWAISEPVRVQAQRAIADRPPGFGIPSVRVDGNDVLACLAVTREALDRVRTGAGPYFIEAVTYRMGPHTTADDPTRYRDPNELEDWRTRDPIDRLAAYLKSEGLFDDGFQAQVRTAADDAAAGLRAACTGLSDPSDLELFDNVYSTPHAVLERQKQHYARYLAGFEAAEGGQR